MTKAHPYAALMLQYAQDAAETDTPWERWEWRRNNALFFKEFVTHPSWCSDNEYRRKPQTITVNGFEVPAPLKEMPQHGGVWLVLPHSEHFTEFYSSDTSLWKLVALSRGLFHTNREAAVVHAKAMLGIDPKGE